MKRTATLVLLVCCLFGLNACQSPQKRVRSTAEQFLKAYYSGEYRDAAGFCTPAYAAKITRIADVQGAVPDAIAEKMKEAVSGTSFNIVSVEVDKEAARAVVHYELAVPMLEAPVPRQLLLQLEGRTAAVDGIE